MDFFRSFINQIINILHMLSLGTRSSAARIWGKGATYLE